MKSRIYPYRVFVSYSHQDRQRVVRLVKVLENIGVRPLWDQHLSPGVEFSPKIQEFIANCHLFVPLLTPRSMARPWLNQEIGFATALAKPILPITTGDPPGGLIAGILAVKLRQDLRDADTKIRAEQIARAVDVCRDRPPLYEGTDDNTQRARLLARYAESVSSLDAHGTVRQRASLTTFHLPTHGPTHSIWNQYFAATPDQKTLFEALRSERIALDLHARKQGCRLIIDPVKAVERVYERHGMASVRARIQGLLSFLREADADVVVGLNNDFERRASITLVGDWFCSEAVTSAVSGTDRRGLRESLFTRHHPVVRQEVEDFDQHLRELLEDRGWTEENSRAEAARYLESYLDRAPDA